MNLPALFNYPFGQIRFILMLFHYSRLGWNVIQKRMEGEADMQMQRQNIAEMGTRSKEKYEIVH